MTEPEFLEYAGTDAAKWADEFCKIARDDGHNIEKEWMLAWFANAIEAGRAAGVKETEEKYPVRVRFDDPLLVRFGAETSKAVTDMLVYGMGSVKYVPFDEITMIQCEEQEQSDDKQ